MTVLTYLLVHDACCRALRACHVRASARVVCGLLLCVVAAGLLRAGWAGIDRRVLPVERCLLD